jgi:hypothetical protein
MEIKYPWLEEGVAISLSWDDLMPKENITWIINLEKLKSLEAKQCISPWKYEDQILEKV